MAILENQRAEVRLSEKTNAIATGGGKPGQGYQAVMTIHGTQDPDIQYDCAHPLCTNGGRENAVFLTGFEASRRDGIRITGDRTNTLQAFAGTGGNNGPMVAIPIHDQATRFSGKRGAKADGKGNGLGIGQPGDPMLTLTAGDRHGVAYPLDLRNATRDPDKRDAQNRQGLGVGGDGEPSSTLTRGFVPGVATDMVVRRLTPIECERLQGFPDNWTLVPQKKVNRKYLTAPRKGYRYAEIDGECWQLMPDGARYKMAGNSMTTTVMHRIGRQLRLYLATYKDIAELVG